MIQLTLVVDVDVAVTISVSGISIPSSDRYCTRIGSEFNLALKKKWIKRNKSTQLVSSGLLKQKISNSVSISVG